MSINTFGEQVVAFIVVSLRLANYALNEQESEVPLRREIRPRTNTCYRNINGLIFNSCIGEPESGSWKLV
jgi:hypothetical protein